MAIITKPAGGILKGVPATITLNKVELAANTLVAADSYFSDSDNWNKVLLKYKSSEGRQYEVVEFNGQLSSPTGFFSVSEKARDLFEIQTLEIIDFDGGIFVVPRGALTTADFDVDFAVEPIADVWEFFGSPVQVVDTYGLLFDGISYGVRRQAFTKKASLVEKNSIEFSFDPSYAFNYATALIGLNGDPDTFQVGTSLSDFFYDPDRSFVIWFSSNGSGLTVFKNTSVVASIGVNPTVSSKIGIYLDPVLKQVKFTHNGVDIGSSVSFADQPSYTQLRFAGYRGDSVGKMIINSTMVYPLPGYTNITGTEQVIQGSSVMWDTNLGGASVEADGGISSGGSSLTKSSSNAVLNGGDYTLTYKWTGLPATDMIHGISSNLNNDFSTMTAITYQQGSLIRYYNYNGFSEYGQRLSLSLVNQSGENTLVMSKVGTVFTMTLNETVLINESNHTFQSMYPMVRTWGVQALTSATITSYTSINSQELGKLGFWGLFNGDYYTNQDGAARVIQRLANEPIKALGFTVAYNGSYPDKMEFTPTSITISGGNTSNSFTEIVTKTFVRNDFTGGVLKYIELDSAQSFEFYKITFNSFDKTYGQSLLIDGDVQLFKAIF